VNILIISTSDIGHGAGISAYQLHCGLRKAGINSNMLVSEKLSKNEFVHVAKPPANSKLKHIFEKLTYKIEYILNLTGPQNVYGVISRGLQRNPMVQQADIIHLHNLHWHSRNFSLMMLPKLCRMKPVLWTLHDMWPLTGHCIYSCECERWKVGCGHCPDLKSYIDLIFDTTSLLCKIKKYIFRRSNFTIVTPSSWLTRLASESPLFENRGVHCIPYGVDQSIFYPRNKNASRNILGLNDSNKKVVLFAASILDAPKKGYKYFNEAMINLVSKYKYDDIYIVTVGRGKILNDLKHLYSIKEMGYIADRDLMAQIYSAADIYVMPSISDNLPNVILESLACGTPVICFNTGGMPDMIKNRFNGYLAKYKDVADLTKCIFESLSNNAQLKEMQDNAVQTINEKFPESLQVQRYIKLYRECLKGT
jgi:glycosyltransferase involved in cell wall biosynthesis